MLQSLSILIKERHVADAFLRAGATSPERAVVPEDIGADLTGVGGRRLLRHAVLRRDGIRSLLSRRADLDRDPKHAASHGLRAAGARRARGALLRDGGGRTLPLARAVTESRRLLQHFLAALAYRTQKALRDAPEAFGDFSAGTHVRTPHDLLWHMTGVIGYARTHAARRNLRAAAAHDARRRDHAVSRDPRRAARRLSPTRRSPRGSPTSSSSRAHWPTR